MSALVDENTINEWIKLLMIDQKNFSNVGTEYLPLTDQALLCKAAAQAQLNVPLSGQEAGKGGAVGGFLAGLFHPEFIKAFVKDWKDLGVDKAIENLLQNTITYLIPGAFCSFGGMSLQSIITELVEEHLKVGAVQVGTNLSINLFNIAAGVGVGILVNVVFRLVLYAIRRIVDWWTGQDSGVGLKDMFPTDWKSILKFVVTTIVSALAAVFLAGPLGVFLVTVCTQFLLWAVFEVWDFYTRYGWYGCIDRIKGIFWGSSSAADVWRPKGYDNDQCGMYSRMTAVESAVDNKFYSRSRNINSDSFMTFLKCPISLDIMVEPVALSCGHVFDKQHVVAHFAACPPNSATCPMCRMIVPVTPAGRRPAIQTKKVIVQFAEYFNYIVKKE